MTKSNKIKCQQLGMTYGRARAILSKSIIFALAQNSKMDICIRCNRRIKDVNDFTVDHKQDWLYAVNPLQTFFDLDNVGFSHGKCNLLAGNNKPKRQHNSKTGYKGVTKKPYKSIRNPFLAVICKDKKRHHIGSFPTAIKAALAYDVTARSLFGDRAVTNQSLGLL